MQKLFKLTLGASKNAYSTGDDFPAEWERVWGGVFSRLKDARFCGGESEGLGFLPALQKVALLRFCRNPAFEIREAARRQPAIPWAP
jgi:hypothetical protein